MAGQTVTLQPGETKTVAFTFVPTAAKTYTVTVGNLTKQFTAIVVPVVDIRIESLSVTPSQVYVGETVSISVVLKNYGNTAGSFEVNVVIT